MRWRLLCPPATSEVVRHVKSCPYVSWSQTPCMAYGHGSLKIGSEGCLLSTLLDPKYKGPFDHGACESSSKPGINMVNPEPCKELRRRPQLFMVGSIPYSRSSSRVLIVAHVTTSVDGRFRPNSPARSDKIYFPRRLVAGIWHRLPCAPRASSWDPESSDPLRRTGWVATGNMLSFY